MDVCAFCLAELMPLNRALTGSAKLTETGASVTFRWVGIPRMVAEDKHTFHAADGSLLPMERATSVDGTPCCALHAVNALMGRRR